MQICERFAPSPTGPLHLGHAFSALSAFGRSTGGRFLLRIEDIDQTRSRPEYEAAIYDDLRWLGLRWETPVLRQSLRLAAYRMALQKLWDMGLLYPCICNRRDIAAASSAPQEGAPMLGPDGVVYPGTCRHTPTGALPQNAVLRLNIAAAGALVPVVHLTETGALFGGAHRIETRTLRETAGDIVLARRDMGTAYHLSVVIDDADQGVTCVTRGADLFAATPIHVLLQRLLQLPTPHYHHHRLIRDAAGKRLAKRDDARAIGLYRAQGATPADIINLLGL